MNFNSKVLNNLKFSKFDGGIGESPNNLNLKNFDNKQLKLKLKLKLKSKSKSKNLFKFNKDQNHQNHQNHQNQNHQNQNQNNPNFKNLLKFENKNLSITKNSSFFHQSSNQNQNQNQNHNQNHKQKHKQKHKIKTKTFTKISHHHSISLESNPDLNLIHSSSKSKPKSNSNSNSVSRLQTRSLSSESNQNHQVWVSFEPLNNLIKYTHPKPDLNPIIEKNHLDSLENSCLNLTPINSFDQIQSIRQSLILSSNCLPFQFHFNHQNQNHHQPNQNQKQNQKQKQNHHIKNSHSNLTKSKSLKQIKQRYLDSQSDSNEAQKVWKEIYKSRLERKIWSQELNPTPTRCNLDKLLCRHSIHSLKNHLHHTNHQQNHPTNQNQSFNNNLNQIKSSSLSLNQPVLRISSNSSLIHPSFNSNQNQTSSLTSNSFLNHSSNQKLHHQSNHQILHSSNSNHLIPFHSKSSSKYIPISTNHPHHLIHKSRSCSDLDQLHQTKSFIFNHQLQNHPNHPIITSHQSLIFLKPHLNFFQNPSFFSSSLKSSSSKSSHSFQNLNSTHQFFWPKNLINQSSLTLPLNQDELLNLKQIKKIPINSPNSSQTIHFKTVEKQFLHNFDSLDSRKSYHPIIESYQNTSSSNLSQHSIKQSDLNPKGPLYSLPRVIEPQSKALRALPPPPRKRITTHTNSSRVSSQQSLTSSSLKQININHSSNNLTHLKSKSLSIIIPNKLSNSNPPTPSPITPNRPSSTIATNKTEPSAIILNSLTESALESLDRLRRKSLPSPSSILSPKSKSSIYNSSRTRVPSTILSSFIDGDFKRKKRFSTFSSSLPIRSSPVSSQPHQNIFFQTSHPNLDSSIIQNSQKTIKSDNQSIIQPNRFSYHSDKSKSSSSLIDLDKDINQADLFYQAPATPKRQLIEDYDYRISKSPQEKLNLENHSQKSFFLVQSSSSQLV